MQQAAGLRLSSIDSFPLGEGNFPRPVSAAEPRKSILKHPCLMIEGMLILCAFRANIKSHFGLLKCLVRHWLLAWEWSASSLLGAASGDCTLGSRRLMLASSFVEQQHPIFAAVCVMAFHALPFYGRGV